MPEDSKPIVEQARQDRMEGRVREALMGYARAADLARVANDMGQLAHAQRHVGDLHRELGQNRAAEAAASAASWREARSLYLAVGVLPGVHECDQHIAQLGLA